jgi:hypothetical protein
MPLDLEAINQEQAMIVHLINDHNVLPSRVWNDFMYMHLVKHRDYQQYQNHTHIYEEAKANDDT